MAFGTAKYVGAGLATAGLVGQALLKNTVDNTVGMVSGSLAANTARYLTNVTWELFYPTETLMEEAAKFVAAENMGCAAFNLASGVDPFLAMAMLQLGTSGLYYGAKGLYHGAKGMYYAYEYMTATDSKENKVDVKQQHSSNSCANDECESVCQLHGISIRPQ